MASFEWPNSGSGSGGGVTSFNTLTGDVILTAGTGLSLSTLGNDITINSTTTFGNLTDAGTDGITITGGTGAVVGTGTSISQHVSDATHNGYLLSTDWVAFNAKQVAGNYITALTGDVTATGPGSVASTVAAIRGTAVSGTTGATNVVFSASPTLTGTLTASAANFSGILSAAGLADLGLTINQAVFTDGSKGLVSNPITGTGNVVMSASPTLTGTITAASANFSGAGNTAINTSKILGVTVTGATSNWGTFGFTDGTTYNAYIGATGGSNTNATRLLGFSTNSATPQFTLDANGLATFTGNMAVQGTSGATIGVGGTANNSNGQLTLNGSSASGQGAALVFQSASGSIAGIGRAGALQGSTSNNLLISSNANSIVLSPGGSTALTLDTSQNATFAGAAAFTGVVTPSSGIAGVTTNSSAATGIVGEFESANPGSGVAVGASNAAVNITSISLTAGDWDLEATVGLTTGGTTVATGYRASLSTTSGVHNSGLSGGNIGSFFAMTANVSYYLPMSRIRISVATTTTVFLVGTLTYSVGGGAIWDTTSFISARRVR